MAVNPTFEELLMKVNELEERIARSKAIEEALKESERFSSSLLENSPDAIIVYNPGSSVRYVNPAFEKITGYTSEETLGTKIPYPWWIDDPSYGTIEERSMLGLKGFYRTERRYRKKNGDHFYVELYVTPIYDDGKLICSFSTWTDISDRKKVEQELRKNSLIINSTSDAVITSDVNGNIILWNSGAEKIFGYKKEEITGKPASLLFKEENLYVLEKIISELLSGNNISSQEVPTIDKNGKNLHVLAALTTLKDEYGNIVELVGLVKDIAELKEMEKSLKNAHDDLEKRIEERTKDLNEANKALEAQSKNLRDLNTALKVLLEKRDKDKEEEGEKILLNVKEFLIPYVEKLKKGPLTESQGNYIELLESGLNDIISPFTQKLTSKYMHLTPRELQVANLVKEGKTSKEIAEILYCTERTVVAHRANLRKKFGLEKKSNLRTYLLTLK